MKLLVAIFETLGLPIQKLHTWTKSRQTFSVILKPSVNYTEVKNTWTYQNANQNFFIVNCVLNFAQNTVHIVLQTCLKRQYLKWLKVSC